MAMDLTLGLNLTSGEERGCGERKEGGLYACCGVGPGGYPLEHFIVDPAIEWLHGPFRGVQYHTRPDGVTDILLWVGAEHYPSMASFLEEGRKHGFSKRIPSTGGDIRYDRLTPGASRLLLIHPQVIPQQPYLVAAPVPPDCVPGVKRPHSGCADRSEQWEGEGKPCTFATWDHAALIDKPGHAHSGHTYAGQSTAPVGTVDITIGSTTFTVALPLMPLKGDDIEWAPGIFIALPLTHFEYVGKEGEMPKKIAELLGANIRRTAVVPR